MIHLFKHMSAHRETLSTLSLPKDSTWRPIFNSLPPGSNTKVTSCPGSMRCVEHAQVKLDKVAGVTCFCQAVSNIGHGAAVITLPHHRHPGNILDDAKGWLSSPDVGQGHLHDLKVRMLIPPFTSTHDRVAATCKETPHTMLLLPLRCTDQTGLGVTRMQTVLHFLFCKFLSDEISKIPLDSCDRSRGPPLCIFLLGL